MLAKIVDARHAGEYRVWLRFSDGLTGEIDLRNELWGPVFEPLKDVSAFAKLGVHPEFDTIVWPNGADLSPEWLYEKVAAARVGTAAE